MKTKKLLYLVLHLLFVFGVFHSLNQTDPLIGVSVSRQAWPYEGWVCLSFYGLFVYLTLVEKQLDTFKIRNPKVHLEEFKRILAMNLILLIFPWGLFLLLAPSSLLSVLEMNYSYLRIIGGMSLIGAILYSLPLKIYQRKITHYILIFGMIDFLISGIVLTFLFLSQKLPLIAWSNAPLVFYIAIFFHEQAMKYQKLAKR